jgi:hypothetical protein
MRFLNKRDTRFVAPTLSRSDPAPGGDRDTIPERSLPLRRCSGQALSAVEGRYELRPLAARFTLHEHRFTPETRSPPFLLALPAPPDDNGVTETLTRHPWIGSRDTTCEPDTCRKSVRSDETGKMRGEKVIIGGCP